MNTCLQMERWKLRYFFYSRKAVEMKRTAIKEIKSNLIIKFSLNSYIWIQCHKTIFLFRVIFKDVTAKGRIGLLIRGDSLVPENYDIKYEPAETAITVSVKQRSHITIVIKLFFYIPGQVLC